MGNSFREKILQDAPFFWIRHKDGLIERGGKDRCSLRDTNLEEERVFWNWDGKRLLVKNDRLGFYPMYYAFFDKSFYVSNSIPKLLELSVPKDMDFDALSVFFRLGFFIGEDTPFRFIKAFPPGAEFTFEKGELDKKSDGFLRGSNVLDCGHNRIVDQYIELVRRAISKRLPREKENFGMCLSGGRDSRHILFELLRQGRVPKKCFSTAKFFSYSDSDIVNAKIIADRTNINLDVVDNHDRTIHDDLEIFFRTNFCSDEHFWMKRLYESINSDIHSLYDGIGVDIYTSGRKANEHTKRFCEKKDWGGCADHILDSRNVNLDKFFTPKFCKKIPIKNAKERMAAELKRHENDEEPYLSFLFWNRTRREIALAPFSILGRGFRVETPFLDIDLLKLIFSLSKNELHAGLIRDDAILKAYPDFADIPFTSGNEGFPTRRYVISYCRYAIPRILSGHFLNKKFLLPRVLALFLNKNYFERLKWIVDPKLIYMYALESLIKN